MTITYNITAINYRLQGLIDAISDNGNGVLKLLDSGGTVLSTVSLANPVGTIDSGVLTFDGQLLDPAAAATGLATNGIIQDAAGTTIVSGLSVGIPLSGENIVLNNGLNSTLITAGEALEVLSAQVTGS